VLSEQTSKTPFGFLKKNCASRVSKAMPVKHLFTSGKAVLAGARSQAKPRKEHA
jgi:hypothetical protein